MPFPAIEGTCQPLELRGTALFNIIYDFKYSNNSLISANFFEFVLLLLLLQRNDIDFTFFDHNLFSFRVEIIPIVYDTSGSYMIPF